MNVLEKIFCYPSFSLLRFLVIITLIQFWWIAIWGLAYIGIEAIAGKNKMTEVILYVILMLSVILLIQMDPTLLQKL